jgi:hypothetical protein
MYFLLSACEPYQTKDVNVPCSMKVHELVEIANHLSLTYIDYLSHVPTETTILSNNETIAVSSFAKGQLQV